MSLYVIILNWNGKADTLTCLEALAPQTPNIVVVDNGSSDNSVAVIKKVFPDVKLIVTSKNLGYAGGNNVGIEYALGQGADLVLLLNNDTIPAPNFIASLQKAAHPTKILGAYPLRFNEPELLDHLGGIWDEKTATFTLVGQNEPKGFKTDKPLDYVCGCSILIPRQVFEAVGLLEPKFFLFWEEADLCWRARQAGFDIEVCYDAHLLHKVSASFTGGKPHKIYFSWRGRLLFIERNCPAQKKWLYKRVLKPEMRRNLKLFLLKKLLFNKKQLQYKAALLAWRDFHNHFFGERIFQT